MFMLCLHGFDWLGALATFHYFQITSFFKRDCSTSDDVASDFEIIARVGASNKLKRFTTWSSYRNYNRNSFLFVSKLTGKCLPCESFLCEFCCFHWSWFPRNNVQGHRLGSFDSILAFIHQKGKMLYLCDASHQLVRLLSPFMTERNSKIRKIK